MTEFGSFPSVQPVMDELSETWEGLKTDMEGRDAVAGGIQMELRAIRGGELTDHDKRLVELLATEPILSILVHRTLREIGGENAAA